MGFFSFSRWWLASQLAAICIHHFFHSRSAHSTKGYLLRFLSPRNSLSRFTVVRSFRGYSFRVSFRSGRIPLIAAFSIVILQHFHSLAICLARSRSALYYYITSIVPAVYPSTIRLPNIQRKCAGRHSKLNNCDGNIWPDYPCQPYAFGLTEKEYEGYLG